MAYTETSGEHTPALIDMIDTMLEDKESPLTPGEIMWAEEVDHLFALGKSVSVDDVNGIQGIYRKYYGNYQPQSSQ